MEVHGATIENMKPAYEGLFTVLNSIPLNQLTDLLFHSTKIVSKAFPLIVKRHVNDFETTDVNFVSSASVLYRGGLISKRKYDSIRSSLTMTKKEGSSGKMHIQVIPNVGIPNLLTYKKLIKKINEINIGELHDVREELCNGLEEDKADGKYRDLLQLLLRLAQFYLFANKFKEDKLEWFGQKEGNFKVLIGGDGAPFGKDDQLLAWLVSFANCGKSSSCPEENYLLFGANCVEDCSVAKRYINLLMQQMKVVEQNSYTVSVSGEKKVSFELELLPNDMSTWHSLVVNFPFQLLISHHLQM